jgi:hypothetical protein
MPATASINQTLRGSQRGADHLIRVVAPKLDEASDEGDVFLLLRQCFRA